MCAHFIFNDVDLEQLVDERQGDDRFCLLRLPFGNEVTNAGLACLARLPQLKLVDLGRNDQVGDAGLAHLKDLENLGVLFLTCAQMTDAGLKNLENLTRVEHLLLNETRLTGAGLVHLEALTALLSLDLRRTGVRDSHLCHLYKLRKLGVVYLRGTSVTLEGINGLEAALPNCRIFT